MLRAHDNWERLVAATLKRQEIWELCHAPSISSRSSHCSSLSLIPDLSLEILPSSYESHQNLNDLELESVVLNVENHPQALKPESIVVNGNTLDNRELIILQSCPNPPKKLKPGHYWYDKFTGFWGKQGEKPSQIISSKLNVGGWLKTKASDGDTFVYLNGREITKLELRVLRLAHVQCFQKDMHFWMNDDGSYHREGDNMVKASIWRQAGIKLVCSLFEIPFPRKSSYASGDLS